MTVILLISRTIKLMKSIEKCFSLFQEQLMKSVKVHEGDSDAIVENFLDSKINLETFLSSYLDKRVVRIHVTNLTSSNEAHCFLDGPSFL